MPNRAETVRRAAEDEIAATDARARYRIEGPPRLKPDRRLSEILGPDEWLVADRGSAYLDRRGARPDESSVHGLGGQLAVTSRRLIFRSGEGILAFPVVDIEEIFLTGELLLILLRDGTGLALDVEGPRLLRVQISAVRAAARAQAVG